MCPDCGGRVVNAVRYYADWATRVQACFGCGWESVPLYRRTRAQRNGEPHEHPTVCPTCRQPFRTRSKGRHPATYCSDACQPWPVRIGSAVRAVRRSA